MKGYIYIIMSILVISSNVSLGQGNFRFAHKQYERMKYAHAIEQYENALNYLDANQTVLKNLANSYYNVGDMKNAQRVYAKFFNDTTGTAEKDDKAIFEYAQTLAQNGQYQNAAVWFGKYDQLVGNKDSRGAEMAKAYKDGINNLVKDSLLYSVKKLSFNSAQSDFGPAFYGNGIVFCSARNMENGVRRVHSWNNAAFLDMYYIDTASFNKWAYQTDLSEEDSTSNTYSYKSANAMLHSDEIQYTNNDSYRVGYYAHMYKEKREIDPSAQAKPFSSTLNTKFHDGPATFNKNQDMIIFTRSNSKGKDKNKVSHLKLFIGYKDENGKWGNIQEFPHNSNEYSVGHPSLSDDGKVLYFSSNMPDGYGGSDIYKSLFNEGKWSKPVNLGATINTAGNELFPYIDMSNVLYFSSNGHPGLGGLDLFKFEKEKLVHLDYPISSKKDDFGIAVWDNGRKGYLSSNRQYGGYDDDIYMFTAVKNIKLQGKVFDKITQKLIPGSIISLKDTAGTVLASTVADSVGFYQLEVDYDQYYKITGSRRNYFDSTEQVTTYNILDEVVKQDLYLWNKLDVALVGQVTERETGVPLDSVHVIIKDKRTNKELFSMHTLADGRFREILEELRLKDSISFNINLSKEKYLTKNVSFAALISDTVVNLHKNLDLVMDKIQVGVDIGKLLDLQPIYFDLGKWDIRLDAAQELDKMVEVMLEHKAIAIELGAHTDCRGGAKYNLDLSDKRAKSSAEYIISKGVDVSRIYGKGYGETKLINHCECEGNKVVPCNEEEHALNRRTEFVVVNIDGI
jgi:outer membrane protein OmpA-like peptidoglycan-associated protein/tetratricopeptide (TPR) repeat protein